MQLYLIVISYTIIFQVPWLQVFLNYFAEHLSEFVSTNIDKHLYLSGSWTSEIDAWRSKGLWNSSRLCLIDWQTRNWYALAMIYYFNVSIVIVLHALV